MIHRTKDGAFVKRALHQTTATERNGSLNADAAQVFDDGLGIVSLDGSEQVWINALQHWDCLGAVASLAAGKRESGETAQSISHVMNLRARSAAAESLGR